MVAAPRRRGREETGLAGLTEGAWIGLLLGAFALYYLMPWWPLSLPLLAACAWLCYVQLPLAVSLAPLAMPFFMLPKHLGSKEFSLGETAIVLCAAAFVLQRALNPPDDDGSLASIWRRFVPASSLERAVALFLVAATVAALAAHFRVYALRQYRLVILEPIVYYVLVVALLRETRAMTRALWALVGAGALVAVLGIGQRVLGRDAASAYFTGPASHPVRHALRLVTSVYGSPNNLGLLLDRAIPVAVVLIVAALALWSLRRTEPLPVIVPLAGLAILLMAVALLLSDTRGGQVTAIAVSLAAVLLWRGKREPRLELAGVGVLIVGILAVLWRSRHGLSTNTHVNVWLSGLRMIRDHLLLGVGPDNFLYYYVNPHAVDPTNTAEQCIPKGIVLPAKHYMDTVNAWQEPCLSHPHNVILDAWLSTGLIGLVGLTLLVIGFALLARRSLRLLPAGSARAVLVACVAIVAATLGHGLVDNSIFVPDLAVAFWLALGLTVNLTALPSARLHDQRGAR